MRGGWQAKGDGGAMCTGGTFLPNLVQAIAFEVPRKF